MLPVPGLRVEGLYGLEAFADMDVLQPRVYAVAAKVLGAWAESKGASIAVHYRGAADPAEARRRLGPELRAIADAEGLELIEGKMVLELVPQGVGRKGAVVERLATDLELRAVLYAGDDVADLEAFEALDALAASGAVTLKVAVRGDETPQELLDAADLEVEGPQGLVALLRQLA